MRTMNYWEGYDLHAENDDEGGELPRSIDQYLKRSNSHSTVKERMITAAPLQQ
jgi:hypothetical protein